MEKLTELHPTKIRSDMNTLINTLESFAGYCADFLIPPVCINCKNRTARHNCLCPKCWYQIKFIVPPICDRLGIPLPYYSEAPQISAVAIAYPPPYNRARSVAHFEYPLKKLIHALKYADRHEGIDIFGRWMAAAGKELLHDADLIIPVPLSRQRLWQRRFNQSALLAASIGKYSRIPVDYLSLRRKKNTRTQVGLTRKQRRKNVTAAFMIPEPLKDRIVDRKIVLVDDVMTTGATINACTKTLIKAKAERIDVLTLARVVEPVPLDL